jgi:ABC-2 type transport system ATP-binding protein
MAVERLTVDVPDKRVLNAVSFALEAGSITALVGPNGAGKSTLMRHVVALETIRTGRLFYNGRDLTRQPRLVHQQVGYLADEFGLYNDLSVARCLEYSARARGLDALNRSTRIQEVVKQARLEALLGTRAGALSKGQRQRLGLGLALIHNPPVLVLDEPASGLDPEARFALGTLLKNLSAAGKSILVSSHILSELESYASHVLILEEGRIKSHVPIVQQNVRRLLLRVLGATEGVIELLEAEAGVGRIEQTATGILFDWHSDDQAQARLLAGMIVAGVAVLALERHEDRLEHVYLREIRKEHR